jgi:hypothetical protein
VIELDPDSIDFIAIVTIGGGGGDKIGDGHGGVLL